MSTASVSISLLIMRYKWLKYVCVGLLYLEYLVDWPLFPFSHLLEAIKEILSEHIVLRCMIIIFSQVHIFSFSLFISNAHDRLSYFIF